MQQLLNKIIEVCTTAGTRILLAIVVWAAGRFLIRKLVAFLQKRDLLRKMEPTVASFVGNFINILLNILLILTVINILGVPMASVVTVLAAAGVAVGMSLQGALSNLAGGIMLMFFRPFSVGDYVSAGGEEGTVKGIALFYTTLLTSDNKRVMIPNGTLMNANITNYSSEGMRRVDLAFSCGKGESVQKVETLMISCLSAQEKVLKDLQKTLDQYAEVIEKQKAALEELRQKAGGFDAGAYFESGDFTNQMLECCRERGIDVHGEYPVFEMFPYRIRIDAGNQDLYMDRKKVACMRPSSFADMIQTGQAKLNKAFFNPASFAEELAAAYDLAALKFNRKKDGDILLGTIYKMLVPMARSRREYDQQSYAFDIARLYNRKNEVAAIKDGRHFQFGPSHNNGKALRILDAEGKEQYLATVRFYQ